MQAWVKCEVKNIGMGMMYDVSFPTESGRKLYLKEISSGLTRRPGGIKQGEWGKGSLAVEMEEPSSGPWDMVQLPKVSEEGMEFVAVKKEDFGLYQEEHAAQPLGEWSRMANATMESYIRSMRENPRHDPETCSLCIAYARARAASPSATGMELGAEVMRERAMLQDRATMVQERLAEVR